ncbi:MAG: cyclic nucleotide-binding domain-containing protein [Desulfobacterales bacterium]|nr:MAG: cyclic nucleotide-binding domain-containing protein [Desulfobacterales bacterium]
MSTLETIKDMPMFKHFSENEKKKFAEIDYSLLGFNKDDVIIKQGEDCSSLYLLVKGTVLITKTGHPTPLCKLTPGAIFGEMSFFCKKPRHSNVIANETVLVVQMDDNFFSKIHPDIKDKIKNYLIELLVTRLDIMNETLGKISTYARGYTLP